MSFNYIFGIVSIVLRMAACQLYLSVKDKDRNTLPVVFFLHIPDDLRRIQSTVHYSLDKYRRELSSFLQSLNLVVESMELFDAQFHILEDIHAEFKKQILSLPSYWEENENVVEILLSTPNVNFVQALAPVFPSSFYSFNILPSKTKKSSDNAPTYESMSQLLVHLTRDWTDQGMKVRELLYEKGVLSMLQRFHPLVHDSMGYSQKILIPGAGVGRLCLEVAAMGYNVEANESSGPMIVTTYNLFNQILPSQYNSNNTQFQYNIYPTLGFPLMDEWDFSKRFESLKFPSFDSYDLFTKYLQISNHFPLNQTLGTNIRNMLSFQYGDFVEIYSHPLYHSYYDVVITCFFIDTSPNILEYISIISSVLKINGIWINLGPLHYHHGTKTAFPYSATQIKQVLTKTGFNLLAEDIIASDYCGEHEKFMKPEYYRVPVAVWQLVRPNDRIPFDHLDSTSTSASHSDLSSIGNTSDKQDVKPTYYSGSTEEKGVRENFRRPNFVVHI